MLNLAVDIGNSFTKAGVFNNNELLEIKHFDSLNKEIIDKLLSEYNITKAVISSVKNTNPDWVEPLQQKTSLIYFTRQMAYGIQNHYKSPQTLGLDRLAGIMGARLMFPDT